ncbi:MAG TPA: LysR substrate-binding domain-containing protein [Sphingobium sp.]
MTTPTLRQLEIFAQMVASGNIADCALALGMAEAAVKSDMRALEKRLGHQLFVIEGIDVALTPVGHKMVDAMAVLMAPPPPPIEEEQSAGVTEEPGVAGPEPDVEPTEPHPVEAETRIEPAAEAGGDQLQPDSAEDVGTVDIVPETGAVPPSPIEDAPAIPADDAIETDAPPVAGIAEEQIPEPLAEQEPLPQSPAESDPAFMAASDDVLELSEFVEPSPSKSETDAQFRPEPEPQQIGTDFSDPLPLPSRLIKAVPSLEDIEWPPPVKRVSWVNEEPLELTEIAPEPVPPADPHEDLPEAAEMQEAVADEAPPVQISPARPPAAQPLARPAPLPIVNTLAVRVVFAAPAPATVPPPTVISLFAAVPLPVPANDPEPAPHIAPAPVIELKHAQQQVTVAAHPSVFGHFQEALTAFEQANPDVAIALELDAFTAMRAEPLLASGEVDIVYYYAMGERERFESRYVWSESLSIFIGADHRLARLEAITVEDLVGVRPVLLGSRNPLRPILDNAMIRGGVDLWHPALETDNLYDIMTAVRDGKGYFAAFGPLARDFGKMPGIRRLPLVDPLPPVEVRQAVREDVRHDPVVSSLAEYLFR